eukprot:1234908-Pyramimonas_sp.AAC.1
MGKGRGMMRRISRTSRRRKRATRRQEEGKIIHKSTNVTKMLKEVEFFVFVYKIPNIYAA